MEFRDVYLHAADLSAMLVCEIERQQERFLPKYCYNTTTLHTKHQSHPPMRIVPRWPML